MRLIQRGPPVVGLSSDASIPAESPGFVTIDVTVRIEPPQKRLPRLRLACSLGSGDMVQPVLEESKLVYNQLRFRISREHCPEDGCLTLSADLDGAVLWQKGYRVNWRRSVPFLDEVS
jgi:hypothetical protein